MTKYSFAFKIIVFLVLWMGCGYIGFSQTAYNMGTTANITTCNAIIYDNGGNNNNYSAGRDEWLTIRPQTGGGAVQLLVEEMDIAETDTLFIYNGSSGTSEPVSVIIGSRASNWLNNSNMIIEGDQTIAATIQNSSGALTLHFVSAPNTVTGTGFKLTVSCITPCQRILTQIDFNQTSPVPHLEDDGYYYVDVCPNEPVHFACYGDYIDNNYSYQQSDATSTFLWEIGSDSRRGVNLTTLDHTFTPGMGSTVLLTIKDFRNCQAMTPIAIRVRNSADPITATPPLDDVCQGEQFDFSVGYTDASNIRVHDVGTTQSSSLAVDSTVFIPDGPNCHAPDGSTCFNSFVNFTCFPAGATITSAADILSVCINLEHSFIGDINIALTCPNGNSALLIPDHTGGGTYFGIAEDDYGGDCNAANNPQGVGWWYCWSENTSYAQNNGDCLDYANIGNDMSNVVDSSDRQNHLSYYSPNQSFSSLIGCPLNGLWAIKICDTWSIDNGYVFNWELTLDPRLMPQSWTYSVPIDSTYWTGGNIQRTSDSTYILQCDQAGSFSYQFHVVDVYGCEFSRTITQTVVQIPQLSLPDEVSICAGSESVVLDPHSTYTGNSNLINYAWSDGQNTAVITARDTGNYILNVTTYNSSRQLACYTSDTTHVNLEAMPVADFEVVPPEGCSPHTFTLTDNTTFADGSSTAGRLHYTWEITSQNGTPLASSSEMQPTFTLSTPGKYNVTLRVITNGGCSDTLTKYDAIVVHAQPVASFSADMTSAGEEGGGIVNFINKTDVSALVGEDSPNWTWNYGDDGEVTHDFFGNHVYTSSGYFTVRLNVTTDFGCEDETEGTVHIPAPFYFYVPNSFTPNGDGINDIFIPQGYLVNEEDYLFTIYDRNGRMMFQTTSLYHGWDGREKGKEVPTGSYVYVIKTSTLEKIPKEFVGTVTLVR